ncbi:hypothetical protein C9374_001969 [Naegleria lovaniensis]|uniref:Uncharacterized protein n=1 Tax=Naegleria lovaniensis TaxID=51637 RepID=A0AA88KMG0_NAELO|nr:uncharacterized protein C9374_001969 [Naegleria lovaniensis]KAG2386934.1 hypothetical protein C9374_001969 [Naegleria lovaniensis]
MSSTNENDDSKASSSHFKKKDVVPPMISKIDLQNKELIRAMENLPSTHQFLSNLSSSSSDPSSSLIKMIPDLIQITVLFMNYYQNQTKGFGSHSLI